MNLTLEITSCYVDGDTTINTETFEAEPPSEFTDIDDWAQSELWPRTGSGRDGDAGYFIEILDCDLPELVGREFEW